MKVGIKFSHFELFKVVMSTVYITSGLIMLSLWWSNASTHFEKTYNTEEMSSQESFYGNEECMNCDEID
tara:strand:+ start:446 stop:652 length:207 start_codon:yes stop_codon:yes gene_type:complete